MIKIIKKKKKKNIRKRDLEIEEVTEKMRKRLKGGNKDYLCHHHHSHYSITLDNIHKLLKIA